MVTLYDSRTGETYSKKNKWWEDNKEILKFKVWPVEEVKTIPDAVQEEKKEEKKSAKKALDK